MSGAETRDPDLATLLDTIAGAREGSPVPLDRLVGVVAAEINYQAALRTTAHLVQRSLVEFLR